MELSPRQQECLATCLTSQYSVITACCGSGKTRLLLAAALLQKKSLILSFNRGLADETRDKAEDLSFDITVSNIHQFATDVFKRCVPDNRTLKDCLSANIECDEKLLRGYDLVCVDEIQDVYDVQIDFIHFILQHNPTAHVLLVGDAAQTVYSFLYDRGVEESLYGQYEKLGPPDFHWTRVTLNETYRLNPETCAFVNQFFRAHDDAPLVSAKPSDGIRPTVHIGDNYDIVTLIDSVLNDYTPSEVMILCNSVRGSASSIIEAHLVHHDVPMNTDHGIILTTFNRAKGLERPVVIVVGLTGNHWKMDQPKCNDGQAFDVSPAAHVAVTRAIKKLHIYVHCYQGLYPTMKNLDAIDPYAEVVVNPKCLLAPTLRIADTHVPYTYPDTVDTFARWTSHHVLQRVTAALKRKPKASSTDMIVIRDDEVSDGMDDLIDAVGEHVLCTAVMLWITRFQGPIMNDLKQNITIGRRAIRKMHLQGSGPWKRRLDTILRLQDSDKTYDNALTFAMAYDSMHVLKAGGISHAMKEWAALPFAQKQPKLAVFTDMCSIIEKELQRPLLLYGQTFDDFTTVPLLSQGMPVVFAIKDNHAALSERALRRVWWYMVKYGGSEVAVYYINDPGSYDVFYTESIDALRL